MTVLELAGVHHVSALSARIRASRDFYVNILGLRPLITTVNQDSPDMYHLFFGDGAGSPGSDMTVFDLPRAAPERRGSKSITRTTFRVAGPAALEYWAGRLDSFGIAHRPVTGPDGRAAIEFEDVAGTRLALVDDGGAGSAFAWRESPVAAEHQIRGLGPVTITVPSLGPTGRFLTDGLGLTRVEAIGGAPEVHRFRMGSGGAHAEVHVRVEPDSPPARYGAGAVHHVALRVPDGQPMDAWARRLDALGYRHTGIVDRHYFRSIYVREPNGVLFELASDGPGFEVDGPIDVRRISLPPFLEPRRAEIEARLIPLDAAT